MIDYSHDYRLVIASLAIALMAGFTGLSLTRGASALPPGRRKAVVAMSAVALGGGVWSMHFVAMLGLQMPVLFYYDALLTLISALIAILIIGVALLIVHFGRRTRARILMAGAVVGAGIPVMHYAGMSGMELCRPVYSLAGVTLAVAASVVLGMAAFWLAYWQRRARNILLGAAGFALAVFCMHFIAMAGTGFIVIPGSGHSGPWMSNATLAFTVTLVAFVISGGFLLTGVTFALPEAATEGAAAAPARPEAPAAPAPAAAPADAAGGAPRVPYERDGRIRFIALDQVAAIRAEGHYTVLYSGADKLFCPWSISEAEQRLAGTAMIRTHRSYLVNRGHVTGFERKKDTGLCYFDRVPSLAKAPVSRARIGAVRALLGL